MPLSDGTPSPAAPKYLSARQLMETVIREPRWAIPTILPEGASILAGKPKVGKSWLALGLALSVASGGCALGRIQVEAGDVLYVALEDTPRRLKSRLTTLLNGEECPDRLTLVAGDFPRIDQGGKEALQAWLADHPKARLVIIDTLARIRGSRTRNGSLYEEDYQAIALLKRIADNAGVAMVIITHTRKMAADDPLDSVNGTAGQTGAADSTLVLKRERTHRDATLFMTGRDIEEQELSLRFDSQSMSWTLLGEKAMSDERTSIVSLLQKEALGLRPTEMALLLGKPHASVKLLAWRMANDGQISKDDQGRYYVKPQIPSNRGNYGYADTSDTREMVSRYPRLPIEVG